MTPKQQLVGDTAIALASYGYDVYLSKNRDYGFYTNGKRVVCFGSPWTSSLSFSGNYAPSRACGTGWQIATGIGVPTKAQADQWIVANAPSWAGNHNPIYTTPEQHLKTYGVSSGYTKFSPEGD